MQIKTFTLPVTAGDKELDELNHFLRSQRIVDVRRELVQSDGLSYWTFCITYMLNPRSSLLESQGNAGRSTKTDYKEVLDSESFERFARMRKLRKEIADSEAIPAYAVFTDAELSEMAKLPVLDTAGMMKILYSGKGYTYKNATNQVDNSATANYIDLPLQASVQLKLGNSLQLQLNAGPYIAFCIGGKVKDNWTSDYEQSFSGIYGSFDYGLQPGAALVIAQHFRLGVDYQIGLASDYKNQNLMIGLAYQF